MGEVKSIMIVGVGGQGTLLASRILGNMLMNQGFDVKVSEVHGMAQRGGSVVTYVKFGDRVYSPVVEEGEADIIMSFEKCEAGRWLSYLKKGGKMLVNDQAIAPMPVITGAAKYPEDVLEGIRAAGADLTVMDALAIAEEAGNAKAVNVVLIGKLASMLPFEESCWIQALKECVPSKFLELNLKAFQMGKNHQ